MTSQILALTNCSALATYVKSLGYEEIPDTELNYVRKKRSIERRFRCERRLHKATPPWGNLREKDRRSVRQH